MRICYHSTTLSTHKRLLLLILAYLELELVLLLLLNLTFCVRLRDFKFSDTSEYNPKPTATLTSLWMRRLMPYITKTSLPASLYLYSAAKSVSILIRSSVVGDVGLPCSGAAGLRNRNHCDVCSVAPSGECLRGKSPPGRMLAYTLAPSVSGSLWAKLGCCGCPAWQSCHWLLSCVTRCCEGWAFCLNYEDVMCYVMHPSKWANWNESPWCMASVTLVIHTYAVQEGRNTFAS